MDSHSLVASLFFIPDGNIVAAYLAVGDSLLGPCKSRSSMRSI